MRNYATTARSAAFIANVLFCLMIAIAPSLSADDATWTGGGDGNWVSGGSGGDDDWSFSSTPAAYPGTSAGEFATFDIASTVAVSSGTQPANSLAGVEIQNGTTVQFDLADTVTLDVGSVDFNSTGGTLILRNSTSSGTATLRMSLSGISPSNKANIDIGSNVRLELLGAATLDSVNLTNNGLLALVDTVSQDGNLGTANLGDVEISNTANANSFGGSPTFENLTLSAATSATFSGDLTINKTLELEASSSSGAMLNLSSALSGGAMSAIIIGGGTGNVGALLTASGSVMLSGSLSIQEFGIADFNFDATIATLSLDGGGELRANENLTLTTVTNLGVIVIGGISAQAISGSDTDLGNVRITNTSGIVAFSDNWAAANSGELLLTSGAQVAFSENVDFSSTTVLNAGLIIFDSSTTSELVPSSGSMGDLSIIGSGTNLKLIGEFTNANDGSLNIDAGNSLFIEANADFSNLAALTYDSTSRIVFSGGSSATLITGANQANLMPLPTLRAEDNSLGKIFGESLAFSGLIQTTADSTLYFAPSDGNIDITGMTSMMNNGRILLRPFTNASVDTTILIGSGLANGNWSFVVEDSRLLRVTGSSTLNNIWMSGSGDFIWTGALDLDGSLLDSRSGSAAQIGSTLSFNGDGVRAITREGVVAANQIVFSGGSRVEVNGTFAAQRGGTSSTPDIAIVGDVTLSTSATLIVGNGSAGGFVGVFPSGHLRTCGVTRTSVARITSATPADSTLNCALVVDGEVTIWGLLLENVGVDSAHAALTFNSTSIVNLLDDLTIIDGGATDEVIHFQPMAVPSDNTLHRMSLSSSSSINIYMGTSSVGTVTVTPGRQAGGTLFGSAFEDDMFSALDWASATSAALLTVDPSQNSTNASAQSALDLRFATPMAAPSTGTIRLRGKQSGAVAFSSLTGANTTLLSGTPDRAFFAGEEVEVYVSSMLQDASSNAIGTTTQSSYRIATDSADPSFTLQSSNVGNTGAGYIMSAVADFDGDGELDLMIGSTSALPVLYLNDGDGNFTASTNTLPGSVSTISAIEAGDLNNDGYMDLVVAEATALNHIYVNTPGNPGVFTQAADAGTINTADVKLADLNGDGALDLVHNSDGTSSILMVSFRTGISPLTYSAAVGFGSGDSQRIVLGDLEGDGDIDGVSADGNNLSVLFNDGMGSISVLSLPSRTGANELLKLVDLDGDGDLDLLVGGTQPGILFNFGCFYFVDSYFAPTELLAAAPLTDADFADVDGDGDLDYILTGVSSTTTILLNDGFGGIDGSLTVGTGTLPGSAIRAGDFNRDNRIDLVVAAGAGQSSLWFNAGLSVLSVQPAQNAIDATPTTPVRAQFPVAVPSVNPGVMAVHGSQSGERSQGNLAGSYSGAGTDTIGFDPTSGRNWYVGEEITVTLTNALMSSTGIALDEPITWRFRVAPTFGTAQFLTGAPAGDSSTVTQCAIAGDFNDDGFLDIAIGHFFGQNYILPGDGMGGFGTSIPFGGSSSTTTGLAAGDFNRDGLLDIAVSNNGAGQGEQDWVYLNQGGSFGFMSSDPGVIAIGTASTRSLAITAGDITGDGWADILVAQQSTTNAQYLNNASGTGFTTLPFGDAMGESFAITLADTDNDGDLDAIVANAGSGQQGKIWLNEGTGRMTTSIPFGPMDASPVWVEAADFNGDGFVDLAIADSAGANTVLFNDGEGLFPTALNASGVATFGTGTDNTYGLAVGDFDADGDLDIMTANDFGGQNRIYLNDGESTPSFSAEQGIGGFDDTPCALAGDFNGDGTIDLFVGNFGAQDRVFLGIPNLEPLVLVTTSVLPQATAGEPYATQLEAIGGLEPYTWTATNPPNWLSLNAQTGEISGTPDPGIATTVTFTITLSDSLGSTRILNAVLQIVLPGVLRLETALPTAYEGMSYSAPVPARGGLRPYTVTLIAGPSWLGLDMNGDLSANVPAGSAGTYSVRIRVEDTEGSSVEGALSLRVITPITISTFAGTGTSGDFGDDDVATNAELAQPSGLTWRSGYLYVSDLSNHRVRKVNATTQIISAVAGTGASGLSGDAGDALQATLSSPWGISFDNSGNLYIADSGNEAVRRVTPAGVIATVLADTGTPQVAALIEPLGMAALDTGIVFVSDRGSHRVWRVDLTNATASVVAGTGTAGYSGDGGQGTAAELNEPAGIELQGRTYLYIADSANHRVRRLNLTTGVIRTIAGIGVAGSTGDAGLASAASLNQPSDIAFDGAGNIFIAEAGGHRVRRISARTGLIKTVVGSGTQGYAGDGGLATAAHLNEPVSLAFSANGSLYIADLAASVVRVVPSLGVASTSTTTSGAELRVRANRNAPSSVAVTPGVREMTLGAWTISAVDRSGAINALTVTIDGSVLGTSSLTALRLFLDRDGNGERDASEPLISPLVPNPTLPGEVTFTFNESALIGSGDSLSLVLRGTLAESATSGELDASIQSALDISSVAPNTSLGALPISGTFPLAGITQMFRSTLPATPQLGDLTLSTLDAEQGEDDLQAFVSVTNTGSQAMSVDSFSILLTPANGGESITLSTTAQSPSRASLAPRVTQAFVLTFDLPAGLAQGAYSADVIVRGTDLIDSIAVRDSGAPEMATLNVFAPLTIKTNSLPAGRLGGAYTALIETLGGRGTVNITLANGVLPQGMTLSTLGVLQGELGEQGSYALLIQATDERGVFVQGAYTLVVSGTAPSSGANDQPGFFISTRAIPTALLNQPYIFTFAATPAGGTWALTNSTLPAGLSLSEEGELSGTATAIFDAPIRVTYTLGSSNASVELDLTVADPAAITPGGQPAGSASGVNVDPNGAGVTSADGDDANLADVDADPRLNFADVQSDDASAPELLSARWQDTNNDQVVSAGDSLLISFNEAVSGGAIADFSLGGSGGSFGVGARLGPGGGANSRSLVLGDGAALVPGTATLSLALGSSFEDLSGNAAIAGNVTISGPGSDGPNVQVLSPASGQSIEEAQLFTIEWLSEDLPSTAEITLTLEQDATELLTIASALSDSGRYRWELPQGLAGEGYLIKLVADDASLTAPIEVYSGEFDVTALGSEQVNDGDSNTDTGEGDANTEIQAYVGFSSRLSETPDESATTRTIWLTLVAPGGALTESYSFRVLDLETGNADPLTDYSYSATYLTFPAGSVTGDRVSVTLSVLNDNNVEGNEHVWLGISDLSPGLAAVNPAKHQFIIHDDDGVAALIVRAGENAEHVAADSVASGARIFDSIVFGQSQACPLPIELFNAGSSSESALVLGTPRLTGDDAANFSIDLEEFSSALGPNVTTDLTLRYNPTALGTHTAWVSITHNAAGIASPFRFQIRATALSLLSSRQALAAVISPDRFAIGDVDADGREDFAAIDTENARLALWRSEGDGEFAPALTLDTGASPRAIAIGDVTGDLIADIVVADHADDTISIYPGRASDTPDAVITLAAGNTPNALALADFNRDGFGDIAVALEDEALLHIFLSDGTGGFGAEIVTMLPFNTNPIGLRAADLNRDGIVDLVEWDSTATAVRTYIGNGDGSFGLGPITMLPGTLVALEVADINRDAKLDIVMIQQRSAGKFLVIRQGNAGGSFLNPSEMALSMDAVSLNVADFNNDGRADIAMGIATTTPGSALWLQNASGAFELERLYEGDTGIGQVLSADFDRDGKRDLLATSSDVQSFSLHFNQLGQPCEQFFEEASVSIEVADPSDVLLADVNRDGLLDALILSSSSGEVLVARGESGGTFADTTVIATLTAPERMRVADIDRDGDLDLIVATATSIETYRNNGLGAFNAWQSFAQTQSINDIAIGDVNDDAWPDLLAGYGVGVNLIVYLGDGAGELLAGEDFSVGVPFDSLAFADFNRDGNNEFAIVSTSSGEVGIITYVNSTGIIGDLVDTITQPEAIRSADMNRDGYPDLVVLDANGDIWVYTFNPDSSDFNAAIGSATNTASGTYRPESMAIADVDNDGKLDVVLIEAGTVNIKTWYGDGSGGFSWVRSTAMSNASNALRLGDVNRDGKIDVIATNTGAGEAKPMINRFVND